MTYFTNVRIKNFIFVCLGFLMVALLYYAFAVQYDPSIAFGDDPAVYLVSAKSIAMGDGYRLTNFPESPIATVFPIGYPAFLSFFLKLFYWVNSVRLAECLATVLSFAWVISSYFFLKSYLKPQIAAMAALALGLAPFTFVTTKSMTSEGPFQILVIAMIGLILYGENFSRNHRAVSKGQDNHNALLLNLIVIEILSGVITGAAMLTRSIGVVFVIGIAAYYCAGGKRRSLLGFLFGVAIVQVPWAAWNYSNHVSSGMARYFHDYRHEASISTPFTNVWSIISSKAPVLFIPFFETRGWLRIQNHGLAIFLPLLIGITIAVLIIVGLVQLLRERNLIAFCCLPYIALVIVCPWEPTRYLMPILPLMFILIACGIRKIYQSCSNLFVHQNGFGSSRLRTFFVAALAVSVILDVSQDLIILRRYHATGSIAGEAGATEWRDRQIAFGYLEKYVPQNAVVVSSFPCATYIFANRHTVTEPRTPGELYDLIGKYHRSGPVYIFATYRVSFQQFDVGTEFGLAAVQAYVRLHPELVKLVWNNPSSTMFIYATTAPASTTH
jgi:hypothetical protein